MLACCAAAFITPLLSTMMNLSLDALGHEFSVVKGVLAGKAKICFGRNFESSLAVQQVMEVIEVPQSNILK